MRKLGLLIAFVFAAAFSYAQPGGTELDLTGNPNAPQIKFTKTTHEFGTIANGGNGTCEFKFTNTGKQPLILSDVKSPCGCTVPEWSKEPIMPGRTGTITVKYDTKKAGAFTKQITVTSNAKTPSVTLTITGSVKAVAQ